MKLEIETERLRLRSYEASDLDAVHRVWSDPLVTKFIRPGWTPTREEVASYFQRVQERWAQDGWGQLAVVLKEEDSLIGYCGFKYVEETPEIELLYGLAQPYWGRGFTTEAAGACLRYVFENTKLNRIIALAYPNNKGSWRVMEKIGMKYEKMAHHYNAELVYYVITRDEFRPDASAVYVVRRK